MTGRNWTADEWNDPATIKQIIAERIEWIQNKFVEETGKPAEIEIDKTSDGTYNLRIKHDTYDIDVRRNDYNDVAGSLQLVCFCQGRGGEIASMTHNCMLQSYHSETKSERRKKNSPPPTEDEEEHYYDPQKYPKYDNYDAINCDKSCEVPCDYFGKIGVPISFLSNYNPNTWDIVDTVRPILNGKAKYKRIIIQRPKWLRVLLGYEKSDDD